MELEELKRKVEEFEKKAGFDKTTIEKLMEMLQEEIDILKNNVNDSEVVNHQLTDLLVLLVQIGYRNEVDFNSELKKWFKKSEKYFI